VAIYATLAFLLVLAVTFFRYAPTTFFAVDDFVYLEWAVTRGWRWPPLRQLFEQRFLSGQGAFFACVALFGVRPGPPHAIIFGLHALNAWLVQRLLVRLEPRQPAIGLSAGGLFLIHPVAYTPLAWMAAGLNEVPTLTLTLLATHLAARFVAGRSLLNVIGAIALLVAAAGFKQHAVVAPAYVLSVAAYCGFRDTGGRVRVRLIARTALLALPLVSGVVLFAHYVLPAVAQSFTGPYTRVLTPESLMRTYALVLWNSLNPFAFFRAGLGYQAAIPETLALWPLELSLAGLIPLALAIWWAATKIGQRRLAALLGVILVATLALPASMPGHVYEYYSYFSLPAATGLVALVLVATGRAAVRPPHRGFVVLAGTLLGLLYAFAAGEILHRSNGLIRQADNARAVDSLTRIVGQSSTMYFVPPIRPALYDTVNGLSVTVLHREKDITVAFAQQPGVPDRFAQDMSTTLVGLDDIDARGWRAYWFDQAQWKAERPIPLLVDRDMIQRVQPHADGLEEIQALITAPILPCRIHYAVDRLGGADMTERDTIAEGEVSCPVDTTPHHVGLSIPLQRRSAGQMYQFRLRMIGDPDPRRAVILFGSNGVPTGMLPVLVEGEMGRPHESTVTHRLVLRFGR
jgi:hypothetical protein